MTWSYQIFNGDLNPSGPGGLATVTGTQKLIQDLRLALLEPRGTDPFHPAFGSLLDGGYMPDGSLVDSPIGGLINAETILAVESEIRRILNAYQQQQLERLKRDAISYGGKNTFAQGEILMTINDVIINQIGDTVLAKIAITTDGGQLISFAQSVLG